PDRGAISGQRPPGGSLGSDLHTSGRLMPDFLLRNISAEHKDRLVVMLGQSLLDLLSGPF
ncbi:MAG: hypothetical protein J4N84_02970, partial [Chloroflexi bacterium]|nr:hypothetical protein [Chloroflexota bacterium]